MMWVSLGIWRRKRIPIYVANVLLLGSVVGGIMFILIVGPICYYYYKRMDEFD